MIDQDFNKFLEEYGHLIYTVNELDLIILRGHLIIEDELKIIISKFVFHSKYIPEARLTFYQMVNIARSMTLDESNNTIWNIVITLNKIRNIVAHSIGSANFHKLINKLKKHFNDEFKDGVPYRWSDGDDTNGLRNCLILCIAFLKGFQAEIVRYKRYVKALDFIVNPHRHKNS